MLWMKAFHVIAVICWFAGLFYLPRLYVYHALSSDSTSIERFKIMERKLYRGIMTPSAIIATALGAWMTIEQWQYFREQGWLHAKLTLVLVLIAYHFQCWRHLRQFAQDKNTHSHVYFRWFNEFPVLLLILIIILVIVRPF